MRKIPHIVLMGGGTGTSRTARGLVTYPVRLSFIFTTADSGGSSGILRKEFGMVPPGDARQCLGAIAEGHPLAGHLHRRFSSGVLRGHTLGNILLASLYEKYGDMQKALDVAVRIFDTKAHELLPATCKQTTLIAHLRGGKKIVGEDKITASTSLQKNMSHLALAPAGSAANPRALRALREADAIVVAPGNFYSSIVPVFLTPDIAEAFVRSRAKKIFISNLVELRGHTDGFTAHDFVERLERVIGRKDLFDVILYNTRAIPRSFLRSARVGGQIESGREEQNNPRYRGAPLADIRTPLLDPADPLASQRSLVRHDSKKLAQYIMKIVKII